MDSTFYAQLPPRNMSPLNNSFFLKGDDNDCFFSKTWKDSNIIYLLGMYLFIQLVPTGFFNLTLFNSRLNFMIPYLFILFKLNCYGAKTRKILFQFFNLVMGLLVACEDCCLLLRVGKALSFQRATVFDCHTQKYDIITVRYLAIKGSFY